MLAYSQRLVPRIPGGAELEEGVLIIAAIAMHNQTVSTGAQDIMPGSEKAFFLASLHPIGCAKKVQLTSMY